MELDVVVVTHNSTAHLDAALKALPAGANVIVIDNASSDESAAEAERHGATVIKGSINAGFAAACNRGARLGTAPIILFLNPDAVIEPDSLEILLSALDDPAVAVASPRIHYPDGSPQRVTWPFPSAKGAWLEALGLHRFTHTAGGGRNTTPNTTARTVAPTNAPVDNGFVIGAVFAVRRDAFEQAGGFDERFWLYGEETDLCKRITEMGWKIHVVNDAVATHIGGASGATTDGTEPSINPLITEHFTRGGEHFVNKHAGARALVSYRLANLAGSVIRGGLSLGAHDDLHRYNARRTARVLTHNPTTVALDSPATRAPAKGLVVCSLEAWDEVWRRNQFFVRELLALDPDLRILFVEPPFDVVHTIQSRSQRRHKPGLRPLDDDGRIIRLEPVKWLPRKAGPWADRWRDNQVLKAIITLGLVEPRLWVNDPSYASLADQVTWPTVYDITDDWSEVADQRLGHQVRRNEERLFRRCEAVTVCSPGLLESRKALRDDMTLIPNAVDTAHLRSPQPRPSDLPTGPCALYVGTLHTDRLDVDLVCNLAFALSHVSVVLVGPDALDELSHKRLDAAGVIRLGPRAYAEVPGYLQHADVLIVPHVVNPFTESLDPIKAYECLAVGTPSVATPVAGFRDLGEPIHITERGSFIETVRSILSDSPEPAPQSVPSWAERTADFAEVLKEIASVSTNKVDRQFKSAACQSKSRRHRSSGTRRLVVNARFRRRPITGVERYATELTARLPHDTPEFSPDPRFSQPPMGHLWEQTRLPMLLGPNDVLWNPCNTGPAFVHNQILTVQDLSPIEHPEWFAPRYAQWLGTLTRSITKRALHILTSSEFTRERLIAICGVDPSRVSIVPCGVDDVFATGTQGLSLEERRNLGVPEGPFLLALATDEPRKNLQRVIDAFQLVKREHPAIELVLAGGRGRDTVFNSSRSVDTALAFEPVRIGYVPDHLLPFLYGSASAFIYVPHYEGFGIPPLEAAMAATPCVLSDIPPLRELGLPAQWADPQDLNSIAEAISRSLDPNPASIATAQSTALEMTWESATEQLLMVFKMLDIDTT